jgi:phosphomannomutase
VIISLLVGRNENLFFTKQVRGRVGMEELSPEESQAIAMAMARGR